MSLQARRALYFKFCVAAKFRLTPAPTSAKEILFLHDSFAKLATLDFFLVAPAHFTAPNSFNREVSVVLNPFLYQSQVDPFSETDPSLTQTVNSLLQRQREISDYLHSICGIPRYSYVENDELYFSGKVLVPFKHTLKSGARHLVGEYSFSSSTISNPFAVVQSAHPQKEILSNIRHNFQKYHKIEPIIIEHGWHGLQRILGAKSHVNAKVDKGAELNMACIANLEEKLPITEQRKPTKDFQGFV